MLQSLRFLPSAPSLGLTGVIDILVVAFLVYQCLMVVRGTRAGPILVGILVMIALYAALFLAASSVLIARRDILE